MGCIASWVCRLMVSNSKSLSPGAELFSCDRLRRTTCSILLPFDTLLFSCLFLALTLVFVIASALRSRAYQLRLVAFLPTTRASLKIAQQASPNDSTCCSGRPYSRPSLHEQSNMSYGVGPQLAISQHEFRRQAILISAIGHALLLFTSRVGYYVILFGSQGWLGPWLAANDSGIILCPYPALSVIAFAPLHILFPSFSA